MGLIDGTTLEIIRNNGEGKVICKCAVCNYSDIYIKKYLIESGQECRYCKKIKKLYEDTNLNETNQLKILLKEEQLRENGELGKLKSGRKYINTYKKFTENIGDNIIVIGVYGEWSKQEMLSPTHIVTKCLKCSALKLREITRKGSVAIKYTCKTCDKIAEYAEEQKTKAKELYGKIAIKEKTNYQKELEYQKELADSIKYEENIRKNNPDSYVQVDNTDNIKTVTLICKKCGFPVKKIRPNKNYLLPDCPGCTKRLVDNNYRGVCQLNMKGRIYNGMEITSQYTDQIKGYLCDIKCAICGSKDSIVKGIYLMDVMKRKYCHDCDYFKVAYKCDHCANTMEITIKQINNKEIKKCPKCGKPLDEADLNDKLTNNDTTMSFNRARLNADGSRPTSMETNTNNNLYYEPIPIYRSNEDNYYRCICRLHGSRLTLTDTEMYSYNCEKCNDVNEELFRVLKPSNIRTKGNLRIKPEG